MDQIHRDMVFIELDIGMGAGGLQQGEFDCLAGGIGGVDYPAVAVSAFTGEVIGAVLTGLAGKGHT